MILANINSEITKPTQKIDELKDFTRPIAHDDSTGRISRIDAINNKSVFDASMWNLQGKLGQLQQALKMTDDADFGICTKCRQSIPFERMKIRPEIRLCANCLKNKLYITS